MVERNLAKVEVASSSLVSRSRPPGTTKAASAASCFVVPFYFDLLGGWLSGHAAACKAVYAGSIPTPASIRPRELHSRFNAMRAGVTVAARVA